VSKVDVNQAGVKANVHLTPKRKKTELFDYLSDSDKGSAAPLMLIKIGAITQKTEYSLQGYRALEAAVGIDNLYHCGRFKPKHRDHSARAGIISLAKQGEQLLLRLLIYL